MTTSFIWNFNLPSERVATDEEYKELLNSIENKINQNNGQFIYVHKVLNMCLSILKKMFTMIVIRLVYLPILTSLVTI